MIQDRIAPNNMLKRAYRRFLVDLGELEGDYRVFSLKDDIAYSSLYISIAILSTVSMFVLDGLLYKAQPGLILWLILLRGGYIFVSILVVRAIRRTSKVRVYDRLIFAWMLVTILFLLSFKFTRPANFLRPSFYIIVPLAIYVFSPFKIRHTIVLALVYSVGTLSIDLFYWREADPFVWNTVIPAQLVGHTIGFVAALQIQSYRRKSFQAYIREKDAREMAAYMANIDPLTKSLTRRHFFSIAESEFLRFRRYRRQLSLLVMDADHFKNINDTYGHYAGDLVLRNLSLVTMEQKRTQDTFGRLGGEEFGLLLPETNLEQAKVVAERIQKAWQQTPCPVDDDVIHSTVSIGVTEARSTDKSFEDVLRRADQMMYKAKEAGRNKIAAA
jgi:diguanylate cyclase (GGDEF)-like protein